MTNRDPYVELVQRRVRLDPLLVGFTHDLPLAEIASLERGTAPDCAGFDEEWVVRKAVTALAGLGLIGGAGSVVYNQHGDATVKIKDSSGKVHAVVIKSNGKSFSCPVGTHDKVKQYDINAGRIELTLQAVRRSERAIERRYPKNVAPHKVVVQFNALVKREGRLVDAYNAQADAHNAIINRDCTASS